MFLFQRKRRSRISPNIFSSSPSPSSPSSQSSSDNEFIELSSSPPKPRTPSSPIPIVEKKTPRSSSRERSSSTSHSPNGSSPKTNTMAMMEKRKQQEIVQIILQNPIDLPYWNNGKPISMEEFLERVELMNSLFSYSFGEQDDSYSNLEESVEADTQFYYVNYNRITIKNTLELHRRTASMKKLL